MLVQELAQQELVLLLLHLELQNEGQVQRPLQQRLQWQRLVLQIQRIKSPLLPCIAHLTLDPMILGDHQATRTTVKGSP